MSAGCRSRRPAAKREVELELGGVGLGGLLASEKDTLAVMAVTREPLNAANSGGFHLPLVLGLNVEQSAIAPPPEPGTGSLFDRNAAPHPIRYSVAQQDRFGRWSEFRSAINEPGPRPFPPRPVMRATYTQPADPMASGGTVRVQVDVPELEALAPGSFPIQELVLIGAYAPLGGSIAHTLSVGDPLSPVAIDFSFSGPILAPTSTRTLRLLAKWRNTNAGESVDCEPQTLTMHDPRPPAQLTVPDTLLYSARPDVTGLAMVEHEWETRPGQANFAVYYTDENRLRAHLQSIAATSPDAVAMLEALGIAADAAERATLFRAKSALFDAPLFERLQGAVFDGAPGRKRFRHAVSGSLRVLNIYRIAADSGTGARVDLTTLPLLIYGVPNADPPARPVIEVTPDDMITNADTYSVRVTITLTPGATQAATWRLRRSNLGATDALRMPIVTMGPMDALDPAGDGRQRAVFTDTGPVVISATATLHPWVRYHWVAETQGAAAPGSEESGRRVPGLWSQPSDPASLILVPPQPPEPASNMTVTGDPVGGRKFTNVVVKFTHPRGLSGGAVGSYRVRLERIVPDRVLVESLVPLRAVELLSETPIVGAGPFKLRGLRADDPSDEPLETTVYSVTIIDPLGRQSAPAEAALG
ncbi:MAG: hypothetical protein ACREWG_12535 [Gammaproteobacteria bacterium]